MSPACSPLTGSSAYIAASRRSDRSLEARVESARRASEIHKRRTGRSLRVTEQDVVNDEMYEEEDDLLPMQYRRLAAHLQTSSLDFNRRLAAYLTNHVAMRSALDRVLTDSHAQKYQDAPLLAQSHQIAFPIPINTQGLMQPSSRQHMPLERTQRSHHPYRRSPYPIPGTPGHRNHLHRSVSPTVPQDVESICQDLSQASVEPGAPQPTRRTSMPASLASANVTCCAPPPSASPSGLVPDPGDKDERDELRANALVASLEPIRQAQPSPTPHHPDISPFSTALPPESRLLLGPTLDPAHPFTSALMGGFDRFPQYCQCDPWPPASRAQTLYPSHDGVNAALAPGALDVASPQCHPVPPLWPVDYNSKSDFDPNFGVNLSDLKGTNIILPDCDLGGCVATPGVDSNWDTFINDNSWVENGAW
jgi:hypothetical protein